MLKIHLDTHTFVAMTPPSVLMNTYVTAKLKPSIDCLSKIFIFGGLIFGLNRVPLFGNIRIVFVIFSLLPTLFYVCHYSLFFYGVSHDPHLRLVIGTHYIQWVFFLVFNLVLMKRLKLFYAELNEFDKQVGCRPRNGRRSIWNLVVLIVTLIFVMTIFVLPEITGVFLKLFLSSMPFVLCVIIEVHYYGHLLSLLIPRVRLINYYMELSLTNSKIMKTLNLEQFGYLKSDSNKTLCDMEMMMDLYHKMITIHKFLVEAVKWQLVFTLITTFLVILIGIYRLSLYVIYNDVELSFILSFMSIAGSLTFSWFSPCLLSDQVHNEVKRLRELLSARIYENQMDAPSRGMARALLAWTETRDLSFSLLRMLDIDISLPFKFVGLLVTYLIILLQFQKIIDPEPNKP